MIRLLKKRLFCAFRLCAPIFVLGCREKSGPVHPIGGGFGIISKWVGVDSGPGATLVYTPGQSEPVLIWPFLGLSDSPVLVTNDLIFLVGDIPDDQGRFGDEIFIAAQAPGPALDISNDLLKLCAESNHFDFERIKGHYVPLEAEAAENGIRITFLGNPPAAPLLVTWGQISNIVQNVKRTGKPHLIGKPRVAYLKND